MSETGLDSPSATLGHNHPPPDPPAMPSLPDDIVAWLRHDTAAIAARSEDLLAGYDRFCAAYPEIPDEAVQGKAADFAKKLKAHIKLLETRRVLEKAPYDEAGKAVQGFFIAAKAPLEKAAGVVEQRQTVFARKLAAQRAREAAERAEALRREADEAAARAAASLTVSDLDAAIQADADSERAAKAASAKPAEHSRVYGEAGGVASLVERWEASVEDLMTLVRAVAAGAAPLDYLCADMVRIRRAVVSDKVRSIPGVRIENITKIRN